MAWPRGRRKEKKKVEEIYKKMTQLEHILARPDTYIGSVESETDNIWVYSDELGHMERRSTTFVPGLYKIFDEILVNAADNKQRDESMNEIKVVIDRDNGSISVKNNGQGIPVTMHKEHNVYIPELIFGHLLTSSNFNDKQKKTTGGRNGYGAKLANIFSNEFIIETYDSENKLHYKQVFSDNMRAKKKPKIKEVSSKGGDWTKITFSPDFGKFGMIGFDDDIIALMKKRVYDIAGTAPKGLKVYLNGAKIKVKDFEDYVNLFLPQNVEKPAPRVYEAINDRWQVCVAVSDGQFDQVSFVNSINTVKGGSHVKYVADQVTSELCTMINKKHKGTNVKPQYIKNYLWIFVNSLIENPAFDSQTKFTLTTKRSAFGSKCEFDAKFFKKVMKAGVVENVLSWARFKQSKELKKNDGKKTSRISGIPKLDDANNAGSRKSKQCTLILTEGDSAKALAVGGLTVVGRDNYGVFPLKGKLLNVRDASHKQIMGNAEISNLKKIVGLKTGMQYDDVSSLRYGSVMIMADQDHDGSHIKGLVINMFHHFWPSLLKIPGFLTEFITPIVKVTKGKQSIPFFTLPEYLEWSEENDNGKGWKIKYYKGLGTSTAQEAKIYFSDLARHKIDFEYIGPTDDTAISMAFCKKSANARKQWIAGFEPGTYLDQDIERLSYTDFVHKELILFSMASNERAIPSVVDGLKPGQRKILFAAFKRKLVKELKVASFAGYVSEKAAYHHGEMSLNSTIVTMAQNYVGCNNVNFLLPIGQFGTRHQGGKDSASARYICTALSPVTRSVFAEDDDHILEYLSDDGVSIEPSWYAPVIPTVLVNGSSGIGTGWSSNIPNYNPRDLVQCVKDMLDGQEAEELTPWYKGFKGEIYRKNANSYHVTGGWEQVSSTEIDITELPVQTWTESYKQFLEEMRDANKIKDFKEYHTDSDVKFTVTMSEEMMSKTLHDGVEKMFKLIGSVATSNMVLFDAEGKLKKFNTANQILEEFFGLRLSLYTKRKEYLVDKLTAELTKLANKVRFILAVVSQELIIRNVKKSDLLEELISQGYTPFPKKKVVDDGNDEDEQQEARSAASDYDYLLSMPLWSLTMEKVNALVSEKEAKEADLNKVIETSEKQMWNRDLDNFLETLGKYEDKELAERNGDKTLKRKVTKKTKKIKQEEEDEWAPSEPKRRTNPSKPNAKPVSSLTSKPKPTKAAAARKPLQEIGGTTKAKGKGVTRKLAPKKKKVLAISSDDENDFSDFEVSPVKANKTPRAKRKTAKTSYVDLDSEAEFSDAFSDDGEPDLPIEELQPGSLEAIDKMLSSDGQDSEGEEESSFSSLADRLAAKSKSKGKKLNLNSATIAHRAPSLSTTTAVEPEQPKKKPAAKKAAPKQKKEAKVAGTFPCPQCPKEYKFSYTLARHLKTHAKDQGSEVQVAQAKRGRVKKAAKPKPKAVAPQTPETPASPENKKRRMFDIQSIAEQKKDLGDEFGFDDESDSSLPEPARVSKAKKQTKAVVKRAVKAPNKKTKKVQPVKDESDYDESDMEETPVKKAPARRSRASRNTKKVTYVESDSEQEEESDYEASDDESDYED